MEQARRALVSGKAKRAVRILRQALEADSANIELNLEYQQAMVNAGSYPQLVEEYRARLKRQSSPSLAFLLANISNSMTETQELISQGLAVDPDHGGLRILQGFLEARTMANQGDSKGAIAHFSKLRSAAPDTTQFELLLGSLHFLAGNLKEAHAGSEEALRLRPYYLDAWGLKSAALEDMHQWETAREALHQAMKYGKADWIYGRLAHLAWVEGHVKENRRYTKFILSAPSSGYNESWRAHALASLGRSEEAEKHYRKAVELSPSGPEELAGLATHLAFAGRLDEAAEFAEQARAAGPENQTVAITMGRLHWAQGQCEEAFQWFEKPLARNSEDLYALMMAGYCGSVLDKDAEKGYLRLERALELAPRHPDILKLTVKANVARNDLYTAAALASRLTDISPDDFEAWTLRGEIAMQAGNPELAKKRFRRAERLAPNREYAEAARERVREMDFIGEGRLSSAAPRARSASFRRVKEINPRGLWAYAESGNLFVGQPWRNLEKKIFSFTHHVSADRRFLWTPDGARIVVADEGIAIVDPETLGVDRLVEIPQSEPLEKGFLYRFIELLGVSNDGTTIYYQLRTARSDSDSQDYSFEAVDLGDRNRKVLYAPEPKTGFFAVYEPQGGIITLAAYHGKGLQTIDVKSGIVTYIPGEFPGLRFHDVSPSGYTLAFANEAGPRVSPEPIGDEELTFLHLKNGDLEGLGLVGGGPRISPQGDKLAYWYHGAGVRILDLKSKRLNQIRSPSKKLSPGAFMPSWGDLDWTTDGRYLLASRLSWGTSPEDRSLGTAIFDLKKRQVWYADHHFQNAVWSPNPRSPTVPMSPINRTTLAQFVEAQREAPQWLDLDEKPDILPAIFIGAFDKWTRFPEKAPGPMKASDLEGAPRGLLAIDHAYGGHAIDRAVGIGIIVPLIGSPWDRGLVQLLRVMAEDDYFGFPREESPDIAAYLGAQSDPEEYRKVIRAHEIRVYEFKMQKIESQYPQLKGIRSEFLPTFQATFGGAGDQLDAKTREGFDSVLSRFATLPPVAEGSVEALLSFGTDLGDRFLGWDSLADLEKGTKAKITPKMLSELRRRLAGHEIGTFLLWQNSD